MADARAYLSLTESIIKSKSNSEGNKRKSLIEIRNSKITEINRRSNIAFKNVVLKDEFASLQVPRGEMVKRSAQLDMMPARYLDIVMYEAQF